MNKFLEGLPSRTRRIFLLKRVDGETFAVIAAMLGISVETVEDDMIWAMKAGRRWIESGDEEIDDPSDLPQASLSDETIEDEAIAWYLRLRDTDATSEQFLRFEHWLVRDPRHGTAYEQAEKLWHLLEMPAHRAASHLDYRPRPCRAPKWRQPWLAAACLVPILVAGAALWRDPGLADRVGADLATRPGESQTQVLADGTSVFLDFDSAAEIDLSGDTRQLQLIRGRVYLDVASNGRPFVIDSGPARIRVMGTRFGVERGDERVEVTVEEGEVIVSGVSDASPRKAAILTAGQQVSVERGSLGETRTVDAVIALAWVRGRILFDRAGMAEIAAQLERMVPGRVGFGREPLADFSLSGSFPADDPQAILNALDKTHGIRARRIAGTLTWLHR